MDVQVTGDYVAEQLPTWNTQGIANIVWAYAKMELCHDALMAAVATNLTGLILQCSHDTVVIPVVAVWLPNSTCVAASRLTNTASLLQP